MNSRILSPTPFHEEETWQSPHLGRKEAEVLPADTILRFPVRSVFVPRLDRVVQSFIKVSKGRFCSFQPSDRRNSSLLAAFLPRDLDRRGNKTFPP